MESTFSQKPFYFDSLDDNNMDRLRNNQEISETQKAEKEIVEKRAYVWCFGKNQNGELGVSSTKDVLQPKQILNGMLKSTAVWISSGCHHTGLVTKAGELLMTGSTLHGKLGLKNLNLMQVTRFNQLP